MFSARPPSWAAQGENPCATTTGRVRLHAARGAASDHRRRLLGCGSRARGVRLRRSRASGRRAPHARRPSEPAFRLRAGVLGAGAAVRAGRLETRRGCRLDRPPRALFPAAGRVARGGANRCRVEYYDSVGPLEKLMEMIERWRPSRCGRRGHPAIDGAWSTCAHAGNGSLVLPKTHDDTTPAHSSLSERGGPGVSTVGPRREQVLLRGRRARPRASGVLVGSDDSELCPIILQCQWIRP